MEVVMITHQFFEGDSFGVAGASARRHKYGNIIFRALLSRFKNVYPMNPIEESIEGTRAYREIKHMPEVPCSLCIVTPPEVTLKIVEQAIEYGVRSVWLQPGADNGLAAARARAAGINVIDDGSCVLVELAKL